MSGRAIVLVAHQTIPRFLQNKITTNIVPLIIQQIQKPVTSSIQIFLPPRPQHRHGSISWTNLPLLNSSPQTQPYDDDKLTIREQLALLAIDRDDDFTIPLGKNLKKFVPKFLTTSQKRNIKRQTYLNEVSKRNDFAFFATIRAFVLLPPFAILGITVATGYLQLFP